ncbi:MAG: NAD(P)H-hydrate epimerase [Sedimentisphaerales bacterium]|nr:NAD(P)H-hydrate epimerase [Sedimentisphaerales bacterium]
MFYLLMSIDLVVILCIISSMKRFIPGKDLNPVLMSRQQVRAFDRWAIETLGVPGVVLMENAGRSCAELILEKLDHIKEPVVSVVCGPGNNGGDGFVIARHLYKAGVNVNVVICGDKTKIKGDAKINLDIVEKMNISIAVVDMTEANLVSQINVLMAQSSLIVDALFGTGLTGKLRHEYIDLIEQMNRLKKPIIAVDIPSGLDCDSGLLLGTAIKALATVTFVAVKSGFAVAGSENYTGDVYVASIGIDPENIS